MVKRQIKTKVKIGNKFFKLDSRGGVEVKTRSGIRVVTPERARKIVSQQTSARERIAAGGEG